MRIAEFVVLEVLKFQRKETIFTWNHIYLTLVYLVKKKKKKKKKKFYKNNLIFFLLIKYYIIC